MPPRLLIPFLLAPALAAQAVFQGDAAEARMAAVAAARDPAVPAFLWIHPKGLLFRGPWELDADYSRVVVARELTSAEFEDGEEQAWGLRLGWEPGPHWLLLSPTGEPLLSGTSQPDPAKWLDAMRGTGWRPRFELRDAFLREHPDNGNAWGEALYEAARYASHRAVVEHRLNAPDPAKDPGLNLDDIDNRPTPPDQDQAQWGPAVLALRGLMGVEGWTEQPHLLLPLISLRVGGVKNSQIMREPLRRLRQGLETALRRRPKNILLWSAWEACWDLSPEVDPRALVQSLDGAPREPWPPLSSSGPLGEAFVSNQDWVGLESLASRAFDDAMNRDLLPYQGKDYPYQVVANWGFWRLLALEKQGRTTEARELVKAFRSTLGSRWPEYASGGLGPSLAFYLGKEGPLVQSLKDAKHEKAPPDPPKPVFPPPLRLALMGHPVWEREWNRYASLAAFDSWEPGEELGWQALKPQEEKALCAHLGWGPQPRWMLLRGEEVLASGGTLPTPTYLADRVRAEGEPYLDQLGAFIRQHPDQLEAREARMGALRSRMPNERLEGTLLEDALVTLEPFHPGEGSILPMVGDWKPRRELWAPAARRALPDLESRLQRWPERRELWEAWLDWAQVSDRPASPARLMENLAIWKSRSAGGAGPLPDGILALVSKRLADEGRWQDLADWCQAFWDGGVREELRRLTRSIPIGARATREHRGEAINRFLKSLVNPYRIALEKLGRTAQLNAFLQEVGEMDPAMLPAPSKLQP